MDIHFDTPNEDELKFILDSWTSSYRKSIYAGTVPNNLWQEVSRASITQLVGRPQSKTLVALTPAGALLDAPRGRIMGYAVAEPGILHWLYVKKDYRRLGIATELLREITKPWSEQHRRFPRFTHNTFAAGRFLPPGWKYDPIPARVQTSHNDFKDKSLVCHD